MSWSRRSFLVFGSTIALPLVGSASAAARAAGVTDPALRSGEPPPSPPAPTPAGAASPTTEAKPAPGQAGDPAPQVPSFYPTQDPDVVREMVGVSHRNLARVRELVEARPTLARAAWDWGFGDWESALGAASHVGNRPIAEYLISKGARPTLFSAAMLGQLDVVKAFVAASPGAQRIKGPHGIPLLAHARAGEEAANAVVQYLETLGDADGRPALTPLTAEQITNLAGTYAFGVKPDERIEIAVVRSSPTAAPRAPGTELNFTRAGRTALQLFHVGDLAFYSAGAEAVRIRFVVSGGPAGLTIHDPDVVLKAERVA